MAGYTDDVATARAIDAEGWLHTGDLGKLDKQGRLVLVSRIKDVVVGPDGRERLPGRRRAAPRRGARASRSSRSSASTCEAGERSRASPSPRRTTTSERAAPRNERARAALRGAFDKLPPGQRPAIVHLYEQRAPAHGDAQGEARRGARDPDADDGGDRARRRRRRDQRSARRPSRAITGVDSRLATETTLQGDLGFDSLRLAELLEALEARGRHDRPDRAPGVPSPWATSRRSSASEPSPAPRRPARAPIESGERAEIVLPAPVQEHRQALRRQAAGRSSTAR